jgi:hypothetical protein
MIGKNISVLGKLGTRSRDTVHNLLFHSSNVVNSCKFMNLIRRFCIDQDAIYCEIFSVMHSFNLRKSMYLLRLCFQILR